ncbi:MAG TPA: hypothetical protein VMD49_03905 [Steroidobacteraceae bacterium]|nr:hypothetical protein [Steroidobacteraceae bacterium]
MRNLEMGNAVRERRRVSRRAFVRGAAVAAAVGASLPVLLGEGARAGIASQRVASTQPLQAHRVPVVGFHMDRPFLDPTGMAEPYVPPAGTRSGQALAELTASEYLSRHPYG